MSTLSVPGPEAPRSPALARWLSLIPGLGQLHYGARRRALQYFAGVAIPAALAALLFSYTDFLAFHAAVLGPVLRLVVLLISELLVLTLVIILVSFWIAAGWDARQGTIALNQGREYRPRWWFIKLKQFLFDQPEEEDASDE